MVATWELAKEVFSLLWRRVLDPLDHRQFQAIFGQSIILEAEQYSAQTIMGLAAAVVALGITYWLIRDRDAGAESS